MPTSAALLDTIRSEVDRSLRGFLDRQRPLVSAPEIAPLVAAAEDFLSGGKRLRPAFCYWGWRGAGGGDDPALFTAAASLELLQASALAHDDVMDASDLRRGMPSAHRRFQAMHEKEGWSGSAEQFGENAAILLGNLLLVWSGEMWRTSGLPPAALAAAQPVYDHMRTELMCGQYLDLLEQVRGASTFDSALRVALFKSGKYSVEQPLRLGLVLAARGREPWIDRLCEEYGRNVGIAFQLRDDILGVFGDPAETGKPAGDDLREGKRTMLIARALAAASPTQAEEVRLTLGDPELERGGVDRLRRVIEETGALAACEKLIDDYLGQALRSLDDAPITPEARTALADLAVAATARRT
ncbi:polyprenyl synthetase [Planomonospora sphaerica]|uniref:Polyprenyl synthetase n=1 Tax=Planomonospora sphaerica TaxID=161355 RepID=A0A161LHT7_9ACTN|nr:MULTISPECIES: polyprenyl synthetase family protein [Planomonospora]GAT64887.1 polyprenyl synthetase [Planomonospora sphaerica]GGL04841.1 geranylgeranyl pyrophosphate synthase [Planomonospora parontospora subsp. antibiotica]GII13537.1 geranylgeranyl pyrophosphate synthase [Planomonospora parontospora subsp. antibiotica]